MRPVLNKRLLYVPLHAIFASNNSLLRGILAKIKSVYKRVVNVCVVKSGKAQSDKNGSVLVVL